MQELSGRIGKIEDNLFILHDKLEEISTIVALQKSMIDDLFDMLTRKRDEDV